MIGAWATPPPPASDRESGLVGREQELARLDVFPAAVETGVHALLVRGEPGIDRRSSGATVEPFVPPHASLGRRMWQAGDG